jgi:hypothetical protein
MGKSFVGLVIGWCLALTGGCSGDQLVLGGFGGTSGCEPGTYAGYYDCSSGSDASFPGVLDASFPGVVDASFPGAVDASFPGAGPGPIVFNLQGDLGGKALYIAPGSKLGENMLGLMFVADLSGMLDCTTRRLSGRLKNITVSTSSFISTSKQDGDLSADYDLRTSSSPPEFVNGVIDNGSTSIGTFTFQTPTCSWTAQRQP